MDKKEDDKLNANITSTFFPSDAVPPSQLIPVAKADSGASRHYITENDANVLTQYQKVKNGPTVFLPNLQTMSAIAKGLLPFTENLSYNARTAHVFEKLQSSSLISLGQLCDDDCNIYLNKQKIFVFKDNDIIIVKYIVSLYSTAMTNPQPNTPLAGPECVLTLYLTLSTSQNGS
jgi:hypothetical protein